MRKIVRSTAAFDAWMRKGTHEGDLLTRESRHVPTFSTFRPPAPLATRRWTARFALGALAVGTALEFGGCAEFQASFRFDDRMLVKIPGPRVYGVKDSYGSARTSGRAGVDDREFSTPENGGWFFRHIAEAPKDKKNAGNWYVAFRNKDVVSNQSLWQVFHGRWERARRLAPAVGDAAQRIFGTYPSMIEPNLVFARMVASKEGLEATHPQPGSDAAQETRQLLVGNHRTGAWPSPAKGDANPAWHLGDDYTQLTVARERLLKKGLSEKEIKIAILDNGFARRHAGVPEYLDEDIYGDAMDWVQGTPVQNMTAPGGWGSTHGTGTIGLLAGRRITISAKPPGASPNGKGTLYEGYLGGAPGERVVPVRVAPWVFSLETASMAYGIDYASRIRGADVMSISHGGSPSQAWVDAINAAYERGTAMFAAEGDFFSFGFDPLMPDPIIVPSSPVYPAAFRRVIGVTGVTAEGRSYARNSLLRWLKNPLDFKWLSRGSYGPDGWRKHFADEADADPAQKRLGKLHAHPLAAYSPNVPWLVAPKDAKAPANLVDLDGSGTSAAEPQAAAAAALWLAYHRDKIGADWKTWKKPEAVYFALLDSARRKRYDAPPDEYLGAGALRASDALDRDYAAVRAIHGPQLDFPKKTAGRDWFDGSRTIGALLFGVGKNAPSFENRANLKQDDGALADRRQAFARMYYNMLLLEEWHKGRIPRGSGPTYINEALRKQGEELAETLAAAPSPAASNFKQ